MKILVINPGSTSTKIAVYNNYNCELEYNIKLDANTLSTFTSIISQYDYRYNSIIEKLETEGYELSDFNVVISRGGLIKPVKSGIYIINEAMVSDLQECKYGAHASNLGAIIAYNIAKPHNINSYIVDPVVVDEMKDVARITGNKHFVRKSIFHALNQKATARKYARLVNKPVEDLNLVIAHLGGGVSIGAHNKGRVIDVNNALDGDGPFSPERSGTLPVGQLIDICFSGNYTKEEVYKLVVGEGGLISYLGTNDAYKVELEAKENEEYRKIQEAMFYQIGKEIGSMCAVLNGNVDAIILTGGMAYNADIVSFIENMCSKFAPITIMPGEDEMLALAENAVLAGRGKANILEYV